MRAAGSAQALRVLFDAHLVDENERILPIVAADPDVSLVEVTHGMHELLGHPHTTNGAEPSHNCGCGETDADDPVLDVRDVPHSIRHATVFGAFDAVPDGGALVLVAPTTRSRCCASSTTGRQGDSKSATSSAVRRLGGCG